MRKFFLPCLLVCVFFVQAQKNQSILHHQKAFTFNVLPLLLIDHTILPGIEFKIRPKLLLTGEAGYIFASEYLRTNNGNDTKASGFIIRPALKFFMNDRSRAYLQPQFFYKQVTHQVYDWLGKEMVNNVASYEQLQNFKYRRKIAGFNIILGTVLPIKMRNSFFDLYAGLGIRKKTSMVVGEHTSSYQRIPIIGNSNNADEGVFPSLPAGVRFIYAFQ